jgi:hypothetical protein
MTTIRELFSGGRGLRKEEATTQILLMIATALELEDRSARKAYARSLRWLVENAEDLPKHCLLSVSGSGPVEEPGRSGPTEELEKEVRTLWIPSSATTASEVTVRKPRSTFLRTLAGGVTNLHPSIVGQLPFFLLFMVIVSMGLFAYGLATMKLAFMVAAIILVAIPGLPSFLFLLRARVTRDNHNNGTAQQLG